MKIETSAEQILNLMDRPAFCVHDGIIKSANTAALGRMVPIGEPIESILDAGADDYRDFHSGSLSLNITLGGVKQGATITRLEDIDIVTLEHLVEEPQLRAYALAAQSIRKPLAQVLSASDLLLPMISQEEHPAASEQIARMNRSLYQLLRLVGNMSDASTAGVTRMELRDVTALLREILDHVLPLFHDAGIQLLLTNHPVPIFTLVDSQKLERAIYNLLSNALKRTPPGGSIEIQLRHSGVSYHLIVRDSGSGVPASHISDVFSRFTRDPGLEENGSGLGLGLSMVRAVALAHHGTLLLTPGKDGGTWAQLSLPIRQDTSTLRSPVMRIDYAGERDHGLIELADVLPHPPYGLDQE